ncbi:MAG: alanine racemase [bacterium]|nr:alanine racemase [bacterium]
MQQDIDGVRTWVEVDRGALKHNFDIISGLLHTDTLLMAVAKSNAYGHDMVQYARELEKLGVDWIGVDSIVEAITVREYGISTPLLVLGYTLPCRIEDAVLHGIAVTVSSLDSLKEIVAVKNNLSIHLKIDTGMSRQGILPEEVDEALFVLSENPQIVLGGVYTHLATAKNPSMRDGTNVQLRRFNEVKDAVLACGLQPIFHVAATGGTFLYPDAHFDMVRVGIGMYGMWPSTQTRAVCEKKYPLNPILTWKTRLSQVKILKKGEGIGYDLTERAQEDMLVGTFPVGYWHGYPRAYSSVAPVLIRRKQARVMGRVSMDMSTVDLSTVPDAKAGDEVVLLGQGIDADYLGGVSETSCYEVTTRINPLIKRVYVG